MLLLCETFKEFRKSCCYREYWQRYTNEEAMTIPETHGVDYGHIKCSHPESKTGWCKEDHKASDCPRMAETKDGEVFVL